MIILQCMFAIAIGISHTTSASKCNLVINEINPDVAVKYENKEFLELKLVCPENSFPFTDISNYKVIIIDHKNNGQPIINVVINLESFSLNENNYFTIGGTEVNESDIIIPSPNIMSRHYFSTKQLSNIFPNCNKLPCGVGLLYSISKLKSLVLTDSERFITLNDYYKNLVKDSLVDLVVYGRRAKSNRCTIFEFLYPDFININYMLRDYDKVNSEDLSLNRCTISTDGFKPASFRLGLPTPSSDNDCDFSFFEIETHIQEITPPLITIQPNDVPMSCHSEISAELYESIETNLVTELISKNEKRKRSEPQCSVMLKEVNTNQQLSKINIANKRIKSMGFSSDNLWDTTSYFDYRWIDFMKNYLPKQMPVVSLKNNKDIQSWFVFLPNTIIPSLSRYKCRLCSEYYDLMKFDMKHRSQLCDSNGELVSQNLKQNQQRIFNHFNKKGHQAVINELIKENNIDNTFNNVQLKTELQNEFYAATAKMFRTVYAEIRTNIAFSNHKLIYELQKSNGIYLGHLYANSKGATEMTKTISIEMHRRLLNHLKSNKFPISIIVDTSDDLSKNHYISVMFQTIEETRPIVYFYKLILLTYGETGLGLYKSLYNQFSEDGLVPYLKNNLVGYVSDGANVMVGQKMGLISYVKSGIKSNIVGVRCMAHRTQLVAGHAMDNVPYYKDFETLINQLHTFYYSKSHKRPQKLREMARELDVIITKLDYLFEVRWLSSEIKALQKVKNMWLVLVKSLEEISNDKKEKSDVRKKAESFKQQLVDKNFVLIMHFTIDILNQLNILSMEFQKSGGLLIGKYYLLNKISLSIEELKSKSGSNMNGLLQSAICQGSDNSQCTLENYETNTVTWQNIKLSIFDAPLLSSFRETFCSDLQQELLSMFPDIETKNFEIFAPNNIPRDKSLLSNYGYNEIKNIYNIFKWDFSFETLYDEWILLLISMIDNTETWCKVNDLSPNLFWSEFLNLEIWTTRTLKLIHTVLVLPVGSADVERSFSYLNIIKTKRRGSLTPEMVDILLRIKMNGPLDISKFKAIEYAKVWIDKEHRLPVDSKSSKLVEKNEYEEDDNPKFVYLDRSALF